MAQGHVYFIYELSHSRNRCVSGVRWAVLSEYDSDNEARVSDQMIGYIARIPTRHGYVIGKGLDGNQMCFATYRGEFFSCSFEHCEVR